MDMLRKAGLVKLERYINHHQTYLLTSAGHRLLGSLGRRSLRGIRPTLPETFVDHELTVAGVGLLLEEWLGRRVMSHRQLYATNPPGRLRRVRPSILPDILVAGPVPCFLEVELSLKSPRRYRSLFEEYRRRLGRLGNLLYLTAPRLKDSILQLGREQRMPSLYAATLEDFRVARERCEFAGAVPTLRFRFAELMPEPAASEAARA